MKSANIAFSLTIIIVLITFAIVAIVGVQHVNATAQTHFRNTQSDGKVIFLSITFFSSLFLTTVIGEILYKKHLSNKK